MINSKKLMRSLSTFMACTFVLSACSSFRTVDGPPAPGDKRSIGSVPEDAVPRAESRSKYGNPKSYVVFGKRYYVLNSSRGYEERGVASWYGRKFHGRRTSSGETYDMYAMTAAHKSLPLPTYVQVTNLQNGRRTVVRVNDRGPFHGNRLIDLSHSAARKLGIIEKGTGLVSIRALQPGEKPPNEQILRAAGSAGSALAKVGIYLQAGAFAVRKNALRLKDRLVSIARHKVWIEKTVSGTIDIFRVRLGPLQSVEEADQLARKMLDLSMDLPQIIIE